VGDHTVGHLDQSAVTKQDCAAADHKVYKEGRPDPSMAEQSYHHRQADERLGYRSRAEVRIAGLLDREGIAYRYEHPLAVVDQGKVRIWYPDFYLPEYGMILEYFGVNGDATYDSRTEHKMRVYETTGVEGVFLNEDSLSRHGPTGITRQIEDVLQQRLRRFYGRPAQLCEVTVADRRAGPPLR